MVECTYLKSEEQRKINYRRELESMSFKKKKQRLWIIFVKYDKYF